MLKQVSIEQMSGKQFNKMQRQKVQLVQQRRKWSDWSECSINCLKTRHRLNCDDILGQNVTTEQINKSSSSPTRITNNKPVENAKRQVVIDKTAALEEDEEELLLKADQIEDDDYADEGDEEDETDSCANVDTSKTFEEIPCLGGLCRPLSASDQEQSITTMPSITGTSISSRHHHRPRVRPSAGRLRDNNNNQQQLQLVQQKGIKSSSLQSAHGSEDEIQQAIRSPSTKSTSTSESTSTGFDNRQSIRQYNSSKHPAQSHKSGSTNSLDEILATHQSESQQRQTVQPNGTVVEVNSVGTNTIWTRNMWPQQLLNGDLGPQANLIQWTILIGSLLTIILLIMLILRKLFISTFPSYHWMLAKQTIKSTTSSGLCTAADCCQSHRHHSLTYNPSSTLVLESDTQHAQHQHILPQRMCYAWLNNNQQQLLDTCETARSISGAYQYVVDANGSHLVGSLTNAKFNIDRPQDLPSYIEASVTNSISSASQRGGGRRRNNNEDDKDSVISNYNYDTLNSSYGNPINKMIQDDKGFILTRDFASSYSNGPQLEAEQSSNTNMKQSRKSIASAESSPAEGNVQMTTDQVRQHNDEFVKGKLRSVNTSKVHDKNRDARYMETVDINNSRSSSISSSGESPSVQSTTAQMLSNAASSSFEQPPDFGEGSTQITTNIGIVKKAFSTSASPASLNGKPRHNNSAKLANLVTHSCVQSQPNSPMFVNQLTNRGFKAANEHALKLSSRLRECSLDNTKDSEYVQPDQADSLAQSQPKGSDISRGFGDTKKVVVRLIRGIEAANDCDNDDRHFYEEIIQQH